MRPKKYPLDLLQKLRAKQVDDAALTLAKATSAREEAERVERSNRKLRDEAEARASAVRENEQGALERGELRAVDLMRGDAWRARVSDEQATLDRRLATATSRVENARGTEDGARGDVNRAQADEDVVARDRSRWDATERKKADAKEEEDASEAWRKRT